MPNITDAELAAIGEHVEATAGVVSCGDELDLPDAIIALCDRRRLLTEVKRLRGMGAVVPDLLAAIRSVEWIASDGFTFCPACQRTQQAGHRDGCVLAGAIAKAEGLTPP